MWMQWVWLGHIHKCVPHSSTLGSSMQTAGPAGPWFALDPNVSEWGTHLWMRPRQTHRILSIRTPVDNSKNFYYCLQGYVLGNTYPCRGFLASPKGYVLPTHIAHLGRLDGFNLPSNNVNTMSLARTYPGIPSSRLEGQYHPHPSALKWANTNLRPSAVGLYCHFRASEFWVVLPPNLLVFPDTSSPDYWYSIILDHPSISIFM